MTDVITNARQMIESRIREIEEETKRLGRALAELGEGGEGRGPRRRASGARSAGRRARKIAPRGHRREQLLAHVEKNPGARPAEIAKAMETTPANVQNVLRKARQDGVVRRRSDGGYELAGSGGPPGGEPEGGRGTNAGNGEAGFVDPAGSRSASVYAEGDGRNR
jgi:MarR family protein